MTSPSAPQRPVLLAESFLGLGHLLRTADEAADHLITSCSKSTHSMTRGSLRTFGKRHLAEGRSPACHHSSQMLGKKLQGQLHLGARARQRSLHAFVDVATIAARTSCVGPGPTNAAPEQRSGSVPVLVTEARTPLSTALLMAVIPPLLNREFQQHKASQARNILARLKKR